VRRDGDRAVDLALGQHLHRPVAARQAGVAQHLRVDAALEVLARRQVADVDHRVDGAEDVGEAPLRHPADERHLAALEARTAAVAAARLLALLAAAGGLAQAGAGAAADALALLLAPLRRGQVVQLHDGSSTISTM
jgi:hypothetical protein